MKHWEKVTIKLPLDRAAIVADKQDAFNTIKGMDTTSLPSGFRVQSLFVCLMHEHGEQMLRQTHAYSIASAMAVSCQCEVGWRVLEDTIAEDHFYAEYAFADPKDAMLFKLAHGGAA